MELEQIKAGAWLHLKMRGRLDATNAREADAQLDEIVRAGEHQIRANMAEVDYLSSAGIRVLVRQRQSLGKLGGAFCIVSPSIQVRTVLELTGLGGFIVDDGPEPGAEEEKTGPVLTEHGGMRLEIFPPPSMTPLEGFLMGDPAKLSTGSFGEGSVSSLRLTPETLAVGVGAFGSNYAEAKSRFGEFMSIGGAGICLPGDGSADVDFMLAQGELAPEAQMLYAVGARGALEHCMRFESLADEEGVPLSALAQMALEHMDSSSAAVVILAETAGLVGAWLRRSPADDEPQAAFFEHPAIRQRLSFAPERMYGRSLALAVGIISRQPEPAIAPFIRPLATGSDVAGHFHATVFTFRVLPHGPFALDGMVQELFEEQSIIGLMHLVNDARPYTGGGESLFMRGALWAGPVAWQ